MENVPQLQTKIEERAMRRLYQDLKDIRRAVADYIKSRPDFGQYQLQDVRLHVSYGEGGRDLNLDEIITSPEALKAYTQKYMGKYVQEEIDKLLKD